MWEVFLRSPPPLAAVYRPGRAIIVPFLTRRVASGKVDDAVVLRLNGALCQQRAVGSKHAHRVEEAQRSRDPSDAHAPSSIRAPVRLQGVGALGQRRDLDRDAGG